MITTRDLLDRLSGVKRSGDGWIARCPAHDDAHQSLSIAEQESRKGPGSVIVLFCHSNAGCSSADICARLRIRESDLFIVPSGHASGVKSSIVATYDYCDETGDIAESSEGERSSLRVVKRGQPYVKEGLVYQSVRVEPGRDGKKKDFFQRRPGGDGWVNDLRPVKERWPWLLPELLASPATIVFIVEGEKDVLTLRALGLTATTSAGGAGKWPGSARFNGWFKGRRLVIIADNDAEGKNGRRAGLDHSNDVARKTKPFASRIQLLTDRELPGLPDEGGDITDWFELGHTVEELLAICERAPDWTDPGKPSNTPRRKGKRLTDDELRDRWLETSPSMIFARGDFWRYQKDIGLWKVRGEFMIKQEIDRVVTAAKAEGVEPTAALLNSVYNLSKARCALEDERLDADSNYLICGNGALYIPANRLEKHNPNLYATTGVSYAYDRKAEGPGWMRYIEWLTGRLGAETVAFLQEYAGLCATTNVKFEIAVWLFGLKGSGKSTFIEGIMAALCDRWCNLGLRNIERSEFALSSLAGKTLAIATELPGEYIKCADLLQAIISGEPLEVRKLYRDFITLTPTVHLLWSTDKMPRIAHAGAGLFRRVKLVNFGGAIPESQIDPDLKEQIKKEGPAILNWLLAGLKRLYERGKFIVPQRVSVSTQAFADVNDTTKSFTDECLEFGESFTVNGGELYKAYSRWCQRNGNKPQSNNAVGLDWVRLGLEKYKSNGLATWRGARFRQDIDDLFETTNAPKWSLDER